ncbi:hypothetical protein Y1Q_0021322 [Alligator mississippiensis]|uniref:Uncharacterized protein n=1 Tax=Alligator mississippiensis TaxID=8496 RepID=A0A151P9C4_ALLMI|nr:hypothetical protein Y1Q_0021322 [Alligator mississippiensis]
MRRPCGTRLCDRNKDTRFSKEVVSKLQVLVGSGPQTWCFPGGVSSKTQQEEAVTAGTSYVAQQNPAAGLPLT